MQPSTEAKYGTQIKYSKECWWAKTFGPQRFVLTTNIYYKMCVCVRACVRACVCLNICVTLKKEMHTSYSFFGCFLPAPPFQGIDLAAPNTPEASLERLRLLNRSVMCLKFKMLTVKQVVSQIWGLVRHDISKRRLFPYIHPSQAFYSRHFVLLPSGSPTRRGLIVCVQCEHWTYTSTELPCGEGRTNCWYATVPLKRVFQLLTRPLVGG